jgi:IS5 family transposase
VKLAKKLGVELRQSYTRVGKFALISISATPTPSSSSAPTGRLRKLKTYLGRVIRDIARKIEGDPGLRSVSPIR